MNILVIHEIDWIKKVPFEPHHLAELFSLQGNNVYGCVIVQVILFQFNLKNN